ncbi:hypothetical protein [Polaromonas glacialis]|uniref:hypothetical protein n=1 Tax=Polaromonas glacialis TaxID=866564 RepID=UPI0012EBFEB1|nr:hypothetical protein [Polaromonas glacialis]
MLHSMCDGLVKARTAQVHQIRAAFCEFRIDLPEGRHWCIKILAATFEWLEDKLPALIIEALRTQLCLILDINAEIDDLELRLEALQAQR